MVGEFEAKLASLHSGKNEDMSKQSHDSIAIALDGFPGDKHAGFVRIAGSWDPEPTGSTRRNERQWSGVALEELAIVAEKMDLAEPLDAGILGANICLEGVPDIMEFSLRATRPAKRIPPKAIHHIFHLLFFATCSKINLYRERESAQ